MKQGDPRGQLLDFCRGMRGKQDGGTLTANNLVEQEAAKFGRGQRIEATCGFVEDDDGRTMQEGSREAQAMHRAGGKSSHLAVHDWPEI